MPQKLHGKSVFLVRGTNSSATYYYRFKLRNQKKITIIFNWFPYINIECFAFEKDITNTNYFTGNIRGLVTRKKLAQDKAEKALSMLKGVLDYSEFRNVDMVIEVCSVKFQFAKEKFDIYHV